ncbi:MAG: hypothetical protein KME20_13045 [Kaiparowitsia implicata GSE-PSE-MK54-09C]|jgi:hypothetical protein|nr:hypothetical protein [Kaiparowitsia implicata GSE-PSE-MK54-09C]
MQNWLFHRHIVTLPPTETEDVFSMYRVAYEFHREVDTRTSLDDYCQWYERVAEQHQQEHRAMQHDINILGWFYRSP